MREAKKKIQYFRSCFEADNRSPQLYSFFSKKVSHPDILNDSDLLYGKIPYLPIRKSWGTPSLKTLSIYEKEKSFGHRGSWIYWVCINKNVNKKWLQYNGT